MTTRQKAARSQLVITCEHAHAQVPVALRSLGLPRAVLASHHAFDVGALPVARALGNAFAAPLAIGRWSRLVADLNRSETHARVIARRVGARVVPGNQLTAAQRTQRLDRYWRPYREEVEGLVADAVAKAPCVHLSVHSFVERLGGVERRNDIGLLFDPRRARERKLVEALRRELVAAGLSVRFNFPYFGHTDGMTSHLRGLHAAARYQGVEIECNQRLARTVAGQRRLARAFVAAVGAALGQVA